MGQEGGFHYSPDKGEDIKTRPQIAIVGSSGKVGDAISRFGHNQDFTSFSRSALKSASERITRQVTGFDITADIDLLRDQLASSGSRTVINAAGAVGVDQMERYRYCDNPTASLAYQTNVDGARNLAIACRELGLKYILLSTECALDENDTPRRKYTESLRPVDNIEFGDSSRFPSFYGLTKALAEQEVLDANPDAVIARLCRVEGPQGGLFASTAYSLLLGRPFSRVSDMETVHLTDEMIAKALLTIEAGMHDSTQKISSIYHLSATEPTTPFSMAQRFAERFGVSPGLVTPMTQDEYINSIALTGRTTTSRMSNVQLDTTNYTKDFGELFPTSTGSVDQFSKLYGGYFSYIT